MAGKDLTHEQVISLWGGRAPGVPDELKACTVERSEASLRSDRALMGITNPSLTVYKPERPNGISLIVAPGGSYRRVVIDKEGMEIAKAFAAMGMTTFILTYRLPGEGHMDASNVTLADGQRAVRLVRQRAMNWALDPDRIGILGFSAAGHLASSLLTGYDRSVYEAIDAADSVSARPDFGALIYPVISMQDPIAHRESRRALLGENPTEEQKADYSPDLHVSAETPSTFLLHADNDPSVSVENSLAFYRALRKVGVSAEMHIFNDGEHGFGIREAKERELPVAQWPALFFDWMKHNGLRPDASC